ncbi:hypothetical protein DPMN_036692 [Dreissena polymorpha]|uniref:Uncharacterized protein n=1 Tax=Dreissena polymorpha TaxID=45954 RepID=A0A9D4M9L0_DREPO|nr:hypothetical protein DPMN_036692 [Dreissena polymorpha]
MGTFILLPEASRPDYTNLLRNCNRRRQHQRPKDPTDTDFELDMAFINEKISSSFFRDEVRNGERRHLIFATDQQLQLLKKAKTWYIDGTFKVVRQPFYQLLSIHSFVRSGDDMKQLPLLFAVIVCV